MRTVICQWCGRTFDTEIHNKKFCSERCKYSSDRASRRTRDLRFPPPAVSDADLEIGRYRNRKERLRRLEKIDRAWDALGLPKPVVREHVNKHGERQVVETRGWCGGRYV